ncbi:transmembrane protein, putative (macronuclear) [Tetrahymena thermophila SB210]|uniref:Transmembrane protein, putative n=1 Tax=Tetrahymena thermophila (strain SB210) TaxID=312017 RepID=Q22ED7_TETTS|nr:transmembrane protein, putative [Tetrahymena thermophila SB210]EAR83591.1 transmembrane protein, putative [Tetrahymena thermophila SB210]|eukprot:XP_001031254.1 transmembrane protein, putative [Tetrahymena thermophila SB210]
MKIIAIIFAIILLVKVNADGLCVQCQKCQKDLMESANRGEVCAKGDTDCVADLKSLGKCTNTCVVDNNYDQQKTNSCVQQNCPVQNPTVQKFKNEFIGCLKKSSSTLAFFGFLIGLFALLI